MPAALWGLLLTFFQDAELRGLRGPGLNLFTEPPRVILEFPVVEVISQKCLFEVVLFIAF